jgi:hypothetical protein
MRIAIDFDGTLVDDDHDYDLKTPLKLKRGALKALQALHAAGHVLILYSSRANRALWEDWRLNPLWANGVLRFDPVAWERNRGLNRARYEQMVTFVGAELRGLFAAVDDGRQGKVMADMYIDDRAVTYGMGTRAMSWSALAQQYGDEKLADEGSDVG